jgi:hypothetical protein
LLTRLKILRFAAALLRICLGGIGVPSSQVKKARHSMIKHHFPMASLLVTGLPLAAGNLSLFIISMAAVIAALPLV